MAHEEGEHFPVDGTAYHQDVTGAESILFFLRPLAPVDARIVVESERNGLGRNVFEDFRPIKQGAVHTAAVRAVVVHDLEVGGRDGGLRHQVLQDMAVFHLGNAQHGMPGTVVLLHLRYHLGHVLQLFGILDLRPLIGAVGQVLIVVLALVMIGIKQVLQIVKTYYVGLSAFLCPKGRACQQKQGGKQI